MEAIGLKFRFSGDRAVANSTAAMAMRGLNQMYDVYQTSRSGSISHRASLVLYFAVGDHHNDAFETMGFRSSYGR